MRRMPELVDRRYGLQVVAPIDEDARVTRKRRRAARHRDDDGNPAGCEVFALRLRALPGRIEYGVLKSRMGCARDVSRGV